MITESDFLAALDRAQTANGDPTFAMLNGGITLMDEPRMKALAALPDAMQAFYAVAILELTRMMERGELAGVKPKDLFICIVKKA